MDVTVWVTGRCNLQCKYCYVDKSKKQVDFSKEKIDVLVQYIKGQVQQGENEKIAVNFFGGEPLICFDTICQIVSSLEQIYDKTVVYSMTTNGLLLDERKANYLKEKGFRVSLSWDGVREANDYNRIHADGVGCYDQIKKSYYLMQDIGLESLRVRATFNSKTYQFIEQSAQEFWNVDHQMSAFFSADFFDDCWNQKQIAEVKKILERIKGRYPRFSVLSDGMLRACRCSGGVTNFHVYMDGKIYPCSFVTGQEQFCIGDIERGIDEKRLRKLTCHYRRPLKECQGCDNEYYCLSYKCRYLNWALMGDMDRPAPIVCQFENIIKGQ